MFPRCFTRRSQALAALGLCLAVAVPAGAAEFERTFTFKDDEVVIETLIGSVRVERSSDAAVHVVVRVRGQDADEKLLRFVEKQAPRAGLTVEFPLGDHQDYVYPALGSGRNTFSAGRHGRHDDWLDRLLDAASADRIEVRGKSFRDAIELWTEVVVQVPKGHAADVRLGAGSLEAERVEGDLRLEVKAGAVQAADIAGDLRIDTGSGRVTARGVRGEVEIDTGSGSVEVADVGDCRRAAIDTGSGSVEARDIAADDLAIDTGSGQVEVADIEVKSLAVDTGSGGVDAAKVAADDVAIDTGSGGVTLELVRMGGGRFHVDTGSGGIRLDVPRDVSADFDIETGSGGIDADIEGVTLDRRQRHEARFTVGGGKSQVVLSTGSGGVRISQAGGTAAR